MNMTMRMTMRIPIPTTTAAASTATAMRRPAPAPRAELIALMKYMVGHNASHANELAQLAKRLQTLGENVAYEQVMQAVSDFEKGNMRLSTVLAAMNG